MGRAELTLQRSDARHLHAKVVIRDRTGTERSLETRLLVEDLGTEPLRVTLHPGEDQLDPLDLIGTRWEPARLDGVEDVAGPREAVQLGCTSEAHAGSRAELGNLILVEAPNLGLGLRLVGRDQPVLSHGSRDQQQQERKGGHGSHEQEPPCFFIGKCRAVASILDQIAPDDAAECQPTQLGKVCGYGYAEAFVRLTNTADAEIVPVPREAT
jgi:hypothetical protein